MSPDDGQPIDGTFSVLLEHREAELNSSESDSDFVSPTPLPQQDSELMVEAPIGGSLAEGFQSQRIILPEDCDRGTAIQILGKQIPQNEFGLPTGYLRSDLLPFPLDTLTQGDVDAAIVKLEYSEGYPTTKKGSLFWSNLEHEPADAFQLFSRFLDQVREIGIRQLEVLSNHEGIELGRVTALYREYAWGPRAKAYDLFQAAADKKRREFRIRDTENHDFNTASALMATLERAFDDPEWVEGLTAMESIEVLEKLVKIRRLSLGLTGQHSSSLAAGTGQGETVEVIMRKLVGAAGGNGLNADMGTDIAALMADPAFGMQAQELIIRATRGSTPITTNQEASF